MSEELLTADQLAGARFGPLTFTLAAGAGAVVHARQPGQLDELLNVLAGIKPALGGSLRLCGEDPAGLPEPRWLRHLTVLGYAPGGGGLLSNLKVWENLVLPLGARAERGPARDLGALEADVVEAFGVAGLNEAWVQRAMPEPPDHLVDFERIVCGLVRCHLCGFRLLVCDRLFEGLDEQPARRLAALVDWLGARRPDSALLVLYHGGEDPGRRFGLSAWGPLAMVSLEGGSWPDS